MAPSARLLRNLTRAAATTIGVAAPAILASSIIGTKLLTDAPKTSNFRASLTVRFHSAQSSRESFHIARPLVEVRGEDCFIAGTWGLRVDGAYVVMGEPLDIGHDEHGPWAVRPYVQRSGVPPTDDAIGDRRGGPPDRRGEPTTDLNERRRRRDRRKTDLPAPWPYKAVLSSYAWPDDPQILAATLGATWEIEAVPRMDGGHLPAWKFTPPSPSKTWFIAVHGRGARRAEVFRLVATALGQGLPCLVVSYRTDAWTSSPTNVTTLGQHEWEDVDAAMRLALSRGADRVVLAGCSMGGGIVASTLRRSDLASKVAGVVLDAPALDWGNTLRHIAKIHRVPSMLVPITMAAAHVRARLDFQAINHLSGAGEFAHPILLIHGTEDNVTPVWLSDSLAEARPDLVTYLRVEGAGHVRSWNLDPTRYERAVTEFLEHAQFEPRSWYAVQRHRLLGMRRETVVPAN